MQNWFTVSNFPENLPSVWDSYWGYIVKQNIAPVWIGEFGTFLTASKDQQWFSSIIYYIGNTSVPELSWTFWCLNPNSGDTGGVLQNDWITVNENKQVLLQTIQFKLTNATSPQPSTSTMPIHSTKSDSMQFLFTWTHLLVTLLFSIVNILFV